MTRRLFPAGSQVLLLVYKLKDVTLSRFLLYSRSHGGPRRCRFLFLGCSQAFCIEIQTSWPLNAAPWPRWIPPELPESGSGSPLWLLLLRQIRMELYNQQNTLRRWTWANPPGRSECSAQVTTCPGAVCCHEGELAARELPAEHGWTETFAVLQSLTSTSERPGWAEGSPDRGAEGLSGAPPLWLGGVNVGLDAKLQVSPWAR